MPEKTKRSWLAVIVAAAVLLGVMGTAVWWVWSQNFGGQTSNTRDAETIEDLEKARYAARHYLRAAETPKARRIVERLLEQYPNDAEGRVLMAKVFMAEGKAEPAYEQFQRSLEIDGRRHEVQFNAGLLAAELDKLRQARQHYNQAVVLDPGNAKYRMYLAQLLMKLDDLDAAQMQLLRARSLDGSLVHVYGMLGEIAARRGKLNMAIDQVNKALERIEDNEPRRVTYLLLKAQFLRRHNKPEAALRVLHEVPPKRQREPRVAEHWAATYLMMSEPAKAAIVWGDLFSIDPTNANAAAEAGLCFLRAGDRESARRYLGLARRADAKHMKVEALQEALAKTPAGATSNLNG